MSDERLDSKEPLSFSLALWVVYADPVDFPGLYVARKHVVEPEYTAPSENFFVAENLTALRKLINMAYPRLVRRPRDEEDDPTIVETWL